MGYEKATGLVVRGSDWSESSRIATIWTREYGKVRVLAKGGRRLKSNFDVALDLLTVCSIVLLRKESGGLELLTEARAEERFPGLKTDLRRLYAGYYIAELLGDGTQDYDPHPKLFEASITSLRRLNEGGDVDGLISAYEMSWLSESGLRPTLEQCSACQREILPDDRLSYSPSAGGLLCSECAPLQRDRRAISAQARSTLVEIVAGGVPEVTREVRVLLGETVSAVLGRRPRLLGYLGS
jgi:DNA repair protein RecO (recombination protein O)